LSVSPAPHARAREGEGGAERPHARGRQSTASLAFATLGPIPKAGVDWPRSDPRNPSNGQAAIAERPPRDGGRPPAPSARPVLATEQSASLRERLIDQLGTINSADEAAVWAHRNLPAKNTLTAADAKTVEERFQARLSTIGDARIPDGTLDGPAPGGTSVGLAPDGPPSVVPDQRVVPASGTNVVTSQKLAQKRPRSSVAAREKVVRATRLCPLIRMVLAILESTPDPAKGA
jgi:hypothetical protein